LYAIKLINGEADSHKWRQYLKKIEMKRTVFVVTAVMAMAMVFVACKDKKPKDNSNNNNNNGGNEDYSLVIEVKNVNDEGDDIAKVEAWVSEMNEYLVASANYTNNGFTMTLPKVPSSKLTPVAYYLSVMPQLKISDKTARFSRVEFIAYDNTGDEIGNFYLEDPITESEAAYVYADKDFTMKGTIVWDDDFIGTFDCTFKKGWNIVYDTENGITTQKPAGASYVWKYWSWGGSGEDDYSMANQKEKSRFPARLHRERRK